MKTRIFSAVIQREGDLYVAQCPEVGTGSQGSSLEEALANYDLDGLQRWKKPIPTPKSMYGAATSPILHGQRLILVLDDDANLPGSRLSRSKVIALDKATGELIWKTPRPYNRGAWSPQVASPITRSAAP